MSLGEHQLAVSLAERYPAPAWAFMRQVRNQTGYSRRVRTADAIAMSLFPSRGLELHGFEIKSDRGDWVRELKDPDKGEEISQFCDRWWVVIGDESIVQPGELPATWGLIVPNGKKLRVKAEAPKLEAKPISRLFLASLLRNASQRISGEEEVAEKVYRACEELRQQMDERHKAALKHAKDKLDELQRTVWQFENRAGVSITGWRAEQNAAAIRFVANGGIEAQRDSMERFRQQALHIAAEIERALKSAAESPEAQEVSS